MYVLVFFVVRVCRCSEWLASSGGYRKTGWAGRVFGLRALYVRAVRVLQGEGVFRVHSFPIVYFWRITYILQYVLLYVLFTPIAGGMV